MIRRVLYACLFVLSASSNALATASFLTGVSADKAQIAADYTVGCALINAAADGDLDTVKKCIATGINLDRTCPLINQYPYGSQTALKVACVNNHTEVVRTLLNAGASSQGALQVTYCDSPEMISLLLEADKAAGFDKADGYAELLYRVLSNQVRHLLDVLNTQKTTPADYESIVTFIKTLVKDYNAPIVWHYYNFYKGAMYCYEPFYYTICCCNTELLELMLSKDLPKNALNTALNQLVCKPYPCMKPTDQIACINLLLKAGATGSFATRVWLAFNVDTVQTASVAPAATSDCTAEMDATSTEEKTATSEGVNDAPLATNIDDSAAAAA